MRRVAGRRSAGFALIEALIAFAIVSIALGTLLGGISLSLRADRYAALRRVALRAAQARLERLGVSEPLGEGWSEGLTEEGQAWRQSVKVMTLPADRGGSAPPPVAAYWAEVSVILEDGGDVTVGAVKLGSPQRAPT